MARRMTRARTGMVAGVVLAAVLVAAAGFGLAGCGVPVSGPPIDFDAPQTDTNPADVSPPEVPVPMTTPLDSMSAYLKAAAVEPGSRTTQLGAFYASPAPGSTGDDAKSLTIIKAEPELVENLGDSAQVRVSGSVIGEYDAFGEFQAAEPRGFSQKFELVRQDDGRWRLASRPEQILLTQAAFDGNYEVAPLYFPIKGGEKLVPDIRYVYRFQSADRKRSDLTNWMLRGPSTGLLPAVESAVPLKTTLKALATTAGTTVVDLSSEAATAVPGRMAMQIAWTLWKTGADSDLDVQINGNSVWHGSRVDVESGNPAAESSSGTIHYITDGSIEPEMPAYNTAELAKNVTSAAFGTRKLALAHGDGAVSVISIISNKDSTGPTPSVQEVTGLPAGGSVGRPAWLDGSTLLVPKGGGLYAVHVDEQGVGKALEGGPIATGVSAVSIAPDGARIAMVVDGKAYVAPLVRISDVPQQITGMKRVGLDITKVWDVGWMAVQSLVVLGQGPENGVLYKVSIDNSSVKALPDLGGTSLVPTQVAAICDNPKDALESISVYVNVNEQIYQLQSAGLRPYAPGQTPGTTGTAPFFA